MDNLSLKSLTGPRVTLCPLVPAHCRALLAAAADGELWNLKVTNVPGPETIANYIASAVVDRTAGTAFPYVVEVGSTVVGSTRFWKYDRINRKVEIGQTWIASSWQRSFVNTETKLLMLSFAFETLGCIRVQFTTDVLNERSRAAILRLGALQEGIVRYERIMPDGRKRDSVRFSIIDAEWPAVQSKLEARLGECLAPDADCES
ncbi:GNAT family N-acetyltransferase [Sphingomonas sp. QA11]|uniref:GNAT family N-acetyltransferase n=1 Tax=Sphingomonas sp. QA11 TaxID=2950605 RepID=UPI00234B306C|nr:GNAT family protein [Sphingomonas sp. QA11]WCM27383.1 GNAT family N-acetyltransferase [Sphingomonas sp. QA11]